MNTDDVKISYENSGTLLTTAFDTCNISSKRESSCLCLPLVSTTIISNPSFLNLSTPSWAIITGSTSV